MDSTQYNLCPVALWAEKTPERKAFEKTTYSELDLLIRKLANCLSNLSSSTIAFIPQNDLEGIALFFAIWRAGKTAFPLSHRLPQPEIEKITEEHRAVLVHPYDLQHKDPSTKKTISPNLLATWIATSSGNKTSGHTFSQHLTAARCTAEALKIDASTRYCLALPLFHVSGICAMMRTFIKGGQLVVKDNTDQATHLSWVPTQLIRYLKSPFRLPNLKCLLIGGAPLAPSALKAALDLSLPLHQSYGMTETLSLVALKRGDAPAFFLPHVEWKIGEDQHLFLRGPTIHKRYYSDKTRDASSWFPTKDLAKYDENGLQIVGRQDRQFISGGENISPELIEKALLEIEGILEAVVEPMDDADYGQIPRAHLYTEGTLTAEEIDAHLNQKLPKFAIPKEYQMRQEPIGNKKMSNLDDKIIGNR